jgi:hypothetical protein
MKVKRSKSDGRLAITKHYFLDDFFRPHEGYPNPLQVANICKLAQILEQRFPGQRLQIFSCFRSLEYTERTKQAYDAQEANAEQVTFVNPAHTYLDRITL